MCMQLLICFINYPLIVKIVGDLFEKSLGQKLFQFVRGLRGRLDCLL